MFRGWPSLAATLVLVIPVGLAGPAAPRAGEKGSEGIERPGAAPRRIASAVLSADEILLELVAPDRLAGVTYLIDDPFASASAGRAPASASRLFGAVEPIVALSPDLVVVAGYTPAEQVAQLASAGLAVLRLERYRSFDDLVGTIERLGRATASEERARALIGSVRARLAAVGGLPQPVPAPRVLVTASGYGFGAETLVDECIRRAGGLNVLSEAGLAGETTLAAETVLALDPDVILVSAPLERPRRGAPGLLGDVERWRTVKALRRRAVHGVPSAWMGSVSLSALLALEATASLLRGGPR